MRVAACAYPIEAVETFEAWRAKQARWVKLAREGGAELVVFPEYATLELSATFAPGERRELARELSAVATRVADVIETYRALAVEHGIFIVGGTMPEPLEDVFRPRTINRARLYTPKGSIGVQDKLQMTRFESEEWGIGPGRGHRVFETELGRIGIATCYDVEFPLIVRRQVEAGARVIVVPSCTDTRAGYHRVMLSCRARALENQCFVVMAPTVGQAPWSLALDVNTGAAGVYGPVDRGFADDGVIVQGALDVAGITFADLDLGALKAVRQDGQVRNHHDWDERLHLDGYVPRERLD